LRKRLGVGLVGFGREAHLRVLPTFVMFSWLDSADRDDDCDATDCDDGASEVGLAEESSLAAAAKTSNTSIRCNKLLWAA
jgi:hypothetical protein